MTASVFAIGYQGVSIERLIGTLQQAGVSVLVDTRETPMSRRPESRRAALVCSLADGGRPIEEPAIPWTPEAIGS